MKEVYDDLSKRLEYLIERYEKFLTAPEGGYTNALFGVAEMLNKQKDSFELRVGSKRFLVKGEIKLSISLRMVYLQTFEIVANVDCYPGKKLKPIQELDIALTPHGNSFIKKILAPNNLLSDPTIIKEFNTQYTDQLWCVIQSIEKSEVPAFDDIQRSF